MKRWRGNVIAEGLEDPRVVKDLSVYRAAISGTNRPIDAQGTLGRRHYYWFMCGDDEKGGVVALLRRELLPDWYAHRWDEGAITVVFRDAVFDVDRHDRQTWREAIAHGRSLGITEKELDFLTE